MKYSIAGIHTGTGKTVASAVLAEALKASYWKPVQAGLEEGTDSEFLRRMCSPEIEIHEERYRLKMPASPHIAARMENKEIKLEDFVLPQGERLIVETAGGIMSPVNEHQSNIDLMKHLDLPVILVISDYLGSINHSMMSIELLKSNGLIIRALIFSGEAVASSREWIIRNSGLTVLPDIPFLDLKDTHVIKNFSAQYAEQYKRMLL